MSIHSLENNMNKFCLISWKVMTKIKSKKKIFEVVNWPIRALSASPSFQCRSHRLLITFTTNLYSNTKLIILLLSPFPFQYARIQTPLIPCQALKWGPVWPQWYRNVKTVTNPLFLNNKQKILIFFSSPRITIDEGIFMIQPAARMNEEYKDKSIKKSMPKQWFWSEGHDK